MLDGVSLPDPLGAHKHDLDWSPGVLPLRARFMNIRGIYPSRNEGIFSAVGLLDSLCAGRPLFSPLGPSVVQFFLLTPLQRRHLRSRV